MNCSECNLKKIILELEKIFPDNLSIDYDILQKENFTFNNDEKRILTILISIIFDSIYCSNNNHVNLSIEKI